MYLINTYIIIYSLRRISKGRIINSYIIVIVRIIRYPPINYIY